MTILLQIFSKTYNNLFSSFLLCTIEIQHLAVGSSFNCPASIEERTASEMFTRRRFNHVLMCISFVVFVLSILIIPSTTELPNPAMEITSHREIDDNNVEVTPLSRLHRIFDDWMVGNRVRMVAEVSKPHIRRWHH